MPHPLGRRHGEEVEARVVLVEDPERGEEGQGGDGLGSEGGEVGGEHPADRGADDRARQRAGGVEGVPHDGEPAEVVVGGRNPARPSKPGSSGTTTSHPASATMSSAGDRAGYPAMPGR